MATTATGVLFISSAAFQVVLSLQSQFWPLNTIVVQTARAGETKPTTTTTGAKSVAAPAEGGNMWLQNN